MKKRIIAISAVLLIIVSVIVGFIITGNSLNSYLQDAVKLFDENKYQESITKLEKAVKKNPNLPEVYFVKAGAELHLKNEAAASESIRNALTLIIDETFETDKSTACLDRILSTDKNNKNSMLLWWYDVNRENENYDGYIYWLEGYLEENYSDEFRVLKNEYEEHLSRKYTEFYDYVLVAYHHLERVNSGLEEASPDYLKEEYRYVNSRVITEKITGLNYAVKDINGDSISELIIADLDGSENVIYAIYGLDGPDVKRLIDEYPTEENHQYFVYENGIISSYSNDGVYDFYSVESDPEDSKKPKEMVKFIESLKTEGTDEKLYFIKKKRKDYSEITAEEYSEELSKYQKTYEFNWVPVTEYPIE